jgi:hypothetical protein
MPSRIGLSGLILGGWGPATTLRDCPLLRVEHPLPASRPVATAISADLARKSRRVALVLFAIITLLDYLP